MAGAISMLVMSIHYFQEDITGILKGKEISSEIWFRYSLRIHIISGMLAIFIGPIQFIKKLRMRSTSVHRSLGFLYSISVIIGSISALVIAQFAMGGLISTLGFSLLAVIWLCATLLSVKEAIKGNFSTHKKWMFISYALTFAAIPQRTMLILAIVTNIPFIHIYQLSAWLPWILNIGIALFIYHRSEPVQLAIPK